MLEQLSLRWNEFQQKTGNAFRNLREDFDFLDVTLACKDGQQIEAHKVILAASSPFFKKILARNKHPHPLIFMRGVKFVDLLAIVDFLYFGETKVFQENLDNFLRIAEELQLEGLMQKSGNDFRDFDSKVLTPTPVVQKSEGGFHDLDNTVVEPRRLMVQKPGGDFQEFDNPVSPPEPKMARTSSVKQFPHRDISVEEKENALPDLRQFSGDLKDLDGFIKSLMEKGGYIVGTQVKAYVCKVCGKEGYSSPIKDHIERNHVEGINVPCNQCEKSFRSRHALRLHYQRYHNITLDLLKSIKS